jgi:type IX secretion system PorP/SprF family membrane protein
MGNVRKIFIFIFIFCSVLINGQDAVFSQFYHNPISTNSALTGVFNGKNRVGTIYRNQWYSVEPNASLTTTDLFYDSKINVLKNDFLGIGIMLFDDRAGLAEIAKTHGYLNLAYSKHLYNNKYRELNQYLVFGAQFGYGVTYLKSSGFLFGSQFDKLSETVDPSLPSGENLLTSKVYPDINTGLVWYYTSRKSTLYLGVAVSHFNSPDI